MSVSIMQSGRESCYLCGRNRAADPCGLEEHHVFGGYNRKLSEKYGLKVYLCGCRCHKDGKEAVHKNRQVDLSIKAAGQMAFESTHGTREEFLHLFGKSYL